MKRFLGQLTNFCSLYFYVLQSWMTKKPFFFRSLLGSIFLDMEEKELKNRKNREVDSLLFMRFFCSSDLLAILSSFLRAFVIQFIEDLCGVWYRFLEFWFSVFKEKFESLKRNSLKFINFC